MKLLPNQTDETALLHLGREGIALLEKRDFQSLANRFGYALAFGKSQATAIEQAWESCLAEFRASCEGPAVFLPSMNVKYFAQNTANLFAVVECGFVSAEGCPMLAELIVSSAGEDRYVTLEEISLASLTKARDRIETGGKPISGRLRN